MQIVLIPGLWLDASSWDAVVPRLTEAGHTATPLTLPGMESRDAERSSLTLDDWVRAVVSALDAADEPVLLVGHSGAAALATAALDARPDKVARVVYLGGFPGFDGGPIVGGFTPEGGELALNDLSMFSEEDLAGLDEQARADLVARAIPVPGRVVTDTLTLTDDARFDVPATAVCLEYTAAQVGQWRRAGEEAVTGFDSITDLTWIDLGTGHWPQLSDPEALAQVLHQVARQPAGTAPWPDPPAATDEVGALVGALERQRATFAWKAGGLDAEGLWRQVGASQLTLGKLLLHLADVEEALQMRLLGTAPPRFTGDWGAAWGKADGMAPEELYETWRTSVLVGRAAIAEAVETRGMDGDAGMGWSSGTVPNVRRVIADTLEEYARHVGHADLLREAVDGVVGEDHEEGYVGHPYPPITY